MKGVVKKLFDLENVRIPKEMTEISVDPQQVEAEVNSLSLRYANQTAVQTADSGDIVYCAADAQSYPDGRTVLLYTAMDIPGAQEAAQAVIGKSVGDCVATSINEKAVTLTVEKIIRLIPAQLNDELVASIGIDGVSTVEGYRSYVTEKKLADARMESHKMAVSEAMNQIIGGSEFEYDEADVESYLDENLDEIKAEYEANDMELPSRDELCEAMLYQLKQGWAAEEFCRRNNIEIDREAAEEEADQMIEMMTLMGENVPSREVMIEESLRNFCVMALFEGIDKFLTDEQGGN